jgi:hypothetical protein
VVKHQHYNLLEAQVVQVLSVLLTDLHYTGQVVAEVADTHHQLVQVVLAVAVAEVLVEVDLVVLAVDLL